MTHWLRGRTVFQIVALALTVLALCAVIVSYFAGGNSRSDFLLVTLVLCYIAFRKELLWRVRNRLLVTYILFGIVPIFLIGLALTFTTELLLGQFATERVRQGLETRIETVRSAAQNLAVAASHGAKADLLDAMRQRVPNLSAEAAPAWIAPGFAGLFESGGRYYIGANASAGSTAGNDAFVYLPLDEQELASLAPGVVSIAGVLDGKASVNFTFGPSGSSMSSVENGVRKQIVPLGLGPPRGWWDVPIAAILTWTVQTSSGKSDVVLPLLSRPSVLVARTGSGQMASIVLSLLIVVGSFFFIVEAVSLFSSFRLTRAITLSVDDLYRGTQQVAKGDFSRQIPVRGKHQLSELATSFNGMTAKIRQLIGEVKKKEKLDAELEIAREVQLRLFPKSVPKLKTLEMAAVCIPGRVVSGDYYDYVRLDDRWTAIALGDVSGKGVSAALLMASIQSALHAQLKFNGASFPKALSTAALMTQISQQLYESTPPEKYATFFFSLYDDETGRLTYTNAGHLKPILVRAGEATNLAGDGMVVGLLPNVQYEQQDVELQTGDLLAIFSDGVPESEDAAEQEFGEARLTELLLAERDQPLATIITAVTDRVEKWTYDPEGRDDLTLLLLRKL